MLLIVFFFIKIFLILLSSLCKGTHTPFKLQGENSFADEGQSWFFPAIVLLVGKTIQLKMPLLLASTWMEERNERVNWETLSDLTAPNLGTVWILCCVGVGTVSRPVACVLVCGGACLHMHAWLLVPAGSEGMCWRLENSTFVCLAWYSSSGLYWWTCLIKCLKYGSWKG